MISEITMNGVASYKQPVTITGLKKFNLFYGLNGTGKSTLSKYMANCHEPGDDFSECKIKFNGNNNTPEILVYNQDFVEENFRENPALRGIFTLDKANKTALEAITDARNAIKNLSAKQRPFLDKAQELTEERETEENKLIEDLWKERKNHDKTILHKCLTGSGNKKANYEKILSYEASEVEATKIPDEFVRLAAELAELSDDEVEKKNHYPTLNFNLQDFEANEILEQKIVGAEDSYLAEIVSKLNHPDWVTQGIKNYIDQTDDCPFCARTMDAELKEKIKAFIDTTYQKKINELEALKGSYFERKKPIEEILRGYKENSQLIKNVDLKNAVERLQNALDLNSRLLEKKGNEPSQPVQLKETLVHIKAINSLITIENKSIDAFNEKIDNRKTAIAEITKSFWQLVRKKHNQIITDFQAGESKRQQKLAEATSQIQDFQTQIKAHEAIVSENQKNTKNVESAIKRINALLKSFGMQGFSIVKAQDIAAGVDLEIPEVQYHIVRDDPSDQEKEFETLSEGEKTLISFLYFVELCRGVDDANKDGDAAKRIIVIDDPISSLSFNLVFDVATLIKDVFLIKSPYRQVLIFTHHLYFLHELFQDTKPELPDNYSLFRIQKAGSTSIAPAKRTDIQNNYQCHWQIVRQAQSNPNLAPVLPNAMRNILEHYFSFVHAKDKLYAALSKLSKEKEDPAYWSFYRAINRQSHLDPLNLTDMAEIDAGKFIQYFREIFFVTDFGSHYNLMMGKDLAANDDAEVVAAE